MTDIARRYGDLVTGAAAPAPVAAEPLLVPLDVEQAAEAERLLAELSAEVGRELAAAEVVRVLLHCAGVDTPVRRSLVKWLKRHEQTGT